MVHETAEIDLERLICPITGSETSATLLEQRGEWALVQCQETGFVFLANPPEYTELEENYAWEVSFEKERQRRREEEPLRSKFSELYKKTRLKLFQKRNKLFDVLINNLPNTNKTIKLLDIGCGTGEFMVDVQKKCAARGLQTKPYGIEVSKELAARANSEFQEYAGSVVFDNAIHGTRHFKPQDIDVVLMMSFLEHEAKPLELLQCVRRILSNDGFIVLKVPNYDCWNRHIRGNKWCGYRFPDHVSYFTPQTLKTLAQQAGYTMQPQTLSEKLPTSDNMYAVLRKNAQAPQE